MNPLPRCARNDTLHVRKNPIPARAGLFLTNPSQYSIVLITSRIKG